MDLVEVPAQPVLSARRKMKPSELGRFLAEIVPRAFAKAAAEQLGPGLPFARFFARGAAFDVEAGVMTALRGRSEGELVAGELPAGKVARSWHVGPYETSPKSWDALRTASKAKGVGWEIYVTDPADQPDSSQWRTQLVLPLN